MGDLTGDIAQVAGDATEPVHTLALACALAEAGGGLELALEHPWSLYTPQDAAVVASALHATLTSTVNNLRALAAAVRVLGTRGDIDLTGPTELSVDEEAPGMAVDRLETVADDVEQHLAAVLPAIAVLQAAPGAYRPAARVHDNLLALVGELGDGARLHTPEDKHDQGGPEDPCGCHIRIQDGSELYYLDLPDMGWSLLRDTDGTDQPDGSKTWHTSGDLHVREPLAHPGHLAEAVMHAIKNDF
ncbi:hypothetical protein [Streptomyces sp. NPDC059271]|uniref:hypothetical protein n=1 Tax=Streptomyces sp. NPDC059271 TaxID=3346799 RepID=UPI0036BF2C83